MPVHPASLYGLVNSNRNFSDNYYWGKNQFNSSFPMALACYMRDQNIPAVYVKLKSDLTSEISEITISDLFNTKAKNNELSFQFESKYQPFGTLVHDELETIDCVIKLKDDYLRPIEIKLTTLPDNSTHKKEEHEYGCELVIRSATMRYLALSMAKSLENEFSNIRKIFEPSCMTIRSWDNVVELKTILPGILNSLNEFYSLYFNHQQPLLMQPIWKTLGKSSILANHCLDIFIWSDFALTKLFMDSASESDSPNITRFQRAALRLARFLFEVSGSGSVYQAPIYEGMSLGNQTDKEFAISGVQTRKYMGCDRLTSPSIEKTKIKDIILGGGQKYLSPERRFDAILYFSNDLFEQ